MEPIPATDAKTNFGALLDEAQRGPVTVSFEEQQQLKLRLLREEVRRGFDALERGNVVSADDAFADVDEELSR